MDTVRLGDLATIFRSKNAGPFMTTIDLFFDCTDKYRRVREANVLTRERIAELYRIDEKAVVGILYMDRINGIKITVIKNGYSASGDINCSDTFGCQQYVPLINLEVI